MKQEQILKLVAAWAENGADHVECWQLLAKHIGRALTEREREIVWNYFQ